MIFYDGVLYTLWQQTSFLSVCLSVCLSQDRICAFCIRTGLTVYPNPFFFCETIDQIEYEFHYQNKIFEPDPLKFVYYFNMKSKSTKIQNKKQKKIRAKAVVVKFGTTQQQWSSTYLSLIDIFAITGGF
jgi:hypothetical protein